MLPGSSTCLRLGGSVTATTTMRSGAAVTNHGLTHMGTSARLSLDARTNTAAGPVRVYLSVRGRPPGDAPGR